MSDPEPLSDEWFERACYLLWHEPDLPPEALEVWAREAAAAALRWAAARMASEAPRPDSRGVYYDEADIHMSSAYEEAEGILRDKADEIEGAR